MKFLITIFFVAALTIAHAADQKGPLVIEVPATWALDFKAGQQFYSLTWNWNEDTATVGAGALLMFSRWPVPGSAKQIPDLVDGIARGFVEQAKDNEEFKLKDFDYKVESIEGEAFSGSFVAFVAEEDFLQTMFMISDGDGIWNGQFTGSKERWNEALGVLKKLKKKD